MGERGDGDAGIADEIVIAAELEQEGGSQLLQHRHCERSEAIQSLSAEGFWIASLRSQ
ncbi:hypothetical protein [Bradyrhizobium nanningense]|uniref:hypothetical protein n=1 Tax=Bradyrhizobium nanningense TaxID=1325118 RepID=UPI0013E8E3E5|nr:hypothetical protein [Bradyrhizobium nanningense]